MADRYCDGKGFHPDKVRLARESMPDGATLASMSSLFKAISDPTRLRILSALQAGVLCVCDLAASLSMTVSAVSHQLSRLRAERLVEARRDGKTIYYSFSDDHVATIFTYAKDHVAEGGRP